MVAKFEIASDNDATSWEDITDIVDWQGARFGGTAQRGAIDTGSGFDLLDDVGTWILPKRRRVRVIETAVTGGTYPIWQGRTIGAELTRRVIRTEDAKQFDTQLVDVNADFGGIGFAGVQRPVEHDTVRIQYLLDTYLDAGQARASTVIGDAWFSTANPYNLIAHLYSGVQLIDWFTHMTDTTNRQFFLTNTYDLFYDTIGSTAYAAGISITDTDPDFIDSFPPSSTARATEDATELFTGVRFRYSGNRTVQVVRSAAETANDQWRTGIVDEEVKSGTEATARANRYLDEFDHEQTTYTCYIDLPADKVDLLSWGMTISFRSAACGILTPTTFRVSRCSWELISPGLWRANLELNFPTKFGRRGVGGGSGNPAIPGSTIPKPPTTGPVPFVPGAAGEFQAGIGSVSFGFPSGLDSAGRADNGWSWYTENGGSLIALEAGAQYRLVFTQSSSFTGGGGDPFDFMATAHLDIGDSTEGSGAQGIATGDWLDPSDMSVSNIFGYSAAGNWTPGKVWTTPWRIWDGTDGLLVDFGIGGTELSGFDGFRWEGLIRLEKLGTAADDDPVGFPAQGQPVHDQIESDGTDDPGSPTPFPFAPTSLIIFVNGVNMTSDLTELDPDAGTYEFDDDIPLGAVIERWYLGTGQQI